jgi:hypothetical protein
MDDSHANPMKTGLMFVPLGLAMSPDFPSPSQCLDHLAELKADIDRGAYVSTLAPSAERRWSFRRLLGRIGDIARVPWARSDVTAEVHPSRQ